MTTIDKMISDYKKKPYARIVDETGFRELAKKLTEEELGFIQEMMEDEEYHEKVEFDLCDTISDLFIWAHSKEGSYYWSAIGLRIQNSNPSI